MLTFYDHDVFIDFYNNGYVSRKETYVNWDPVEQSVLANEQVINGRGWRSNAVVERKKLSQPSQIKTCGSTFKNASKEKKAWMLIKEAGCENYREGDAMISQKHCNFFVNNGNAKSSDIENLINKVKKRVQEKTGIDLELEIKIVGEK